MSVFSAKIDLGAAEKKLQELARRVSNLRPAFLEIREVLIESTQRRFVDQRDPDGRAWEPLRESTLASSKKRKSRFPTGILKQSGQLAENINGSATATSLAIGSPEVYSAIQQFGGPTPNGGVIPERPFLGLSEGDRSSIFSIIEDHLSPD